MLQRHKPAHLPDEPEVKQVLLDCRGRFFLIPAFSVVVGVGEQFHF
jgi:hypothetical protein